MDAFQETDSADKHAWFLAIFKWQAWGNTQFQNVEFCPQGRIQRNHKNKRLLCEMFMWYEDYITALAVWAVIRSGDEDLQLLSITDTLIDTP